MVALPIVGKKPVNVTTGDAAGGADGAFFSSVREVQQRSLTSCAGRASDMHLVSFERRLPVGTCAGNFDEDLVALKHSFDVQQAEPRHRAGGSLDPIRVRESSAEH